MFSVVHFKDTNEMEVVHRNWLITDNSCAWPPFISPTKIKKLLLAGTIPSNTWQPNEILVIGHFDTFEKAEKLRDDLSDIVMNIKTEVVEPPPKPAKRHKPTPVIVPLVANVNDDCESQTDNTVGQSDALQPGLPSPYTTTTNAESGNLNNGIIINVSDEPTGVMLNLLFEIKAEVLNLKSEVLNVKSDILNIKNQLNQLGATSSDQISMQLPKIPCESMTDLLELEEYLQNDSNYLQMVKDMSNKGGTTVKQVTFRILREIFWPSLANQFSWAGRKKLPFKDFKVAKVVFGAVIKNKFISNANATDIEEYCKRWFKYANERYRNML